MLAQRIAEPACLRPLRVVEIPLRRAVVEFDTAIGRRLRRMRVPQEGDVPWLLHQRPKRGIVGIRMGSCGKSEEHGKRQYCRPKRMRTTEKPMHGVAQDSVGSPAAFHAIIPPAMWDL